MANNELTIDDVWILDIRESNAMWTWHRWWMVEFAIKLTGYKDVHDIDGIIYELYSSDAMQSARRMQEHVERAYIRSSASHMQYSGMMNELGGTMPVDTFQVLMRYLAFYDETKINMALGFLKSKVMALRSDQKKKTTTQAVEPTSVPGAMMTSLPKKWKNETGIHTLYTSNE